MSHVKTYARIAAIGWALVPIAWSITAVLGRHRDWDEGPVTAYQLGALALLGASLLTVLVVSGLPARRSRPRNAAIVLGGIATLASVVAWALPLWMVPWTIAGGLAALAIPALRLQMAVLAGSMGLAVLAFFVLTVLEVGRPDSYGDYPVADVTAYVIATVGAALAMMLTVRAGQTAATNELRAVEPQSTG